MPNTPDPQRQNTPERTAVEEYLTRRLSVPAATAATIPDTIITAVIAEPEAGLAAVLEHLQRKTPHQLQRHVKDLRNRLAAVIADLWGRMPHYGTFVHRDTTPRAVRAAQIKHFHGQVEDVPELARNRDYATAFIGHQDAAANAALAVLNKYGQDRTAFIIEQFADDGVRWAPGRLRAMRETAAATESRRTRSIEDLQSVLGQRDRQASHWAFHTLSAQAQVAAHCVTNGMVQCVYAGRPTVSQETPSRYLNDRLIEFILRWPAVPSEQDVQTVLDEMWRRIDADSIERHEFVISQARKAAAEGRDRIVILYGGQHTNHGTIQRSFSNPLDEGLRGAEIQTDVFEPAGYDGALALSKDDLTELTAEKMLLLIRKHAGQVDLNTPRRQTPATTLTSHPGFVPVQIQSPTAPRVTIQTLRAPESPEAAEHARIRIAVDEAIRRGIVREEVFASPQTNARHGYLFSTRHYQNGQYDPAKTLPETKHSQAQLVQLMCLLQRHGVSSPVFLEGRQNGMGYNTLHPGIPRPQLNVNGRIVDMHDPLAQHAMSEHVEAVISVFDHIQRHAGRFGSSAPCFNQVTPYAHFKGAQAAASMGMMETMNQYMDWEADFRRRYDSFLSGFNGGSIQIETYWRPGNADPLLNLAGTLYPAAQLEADARMYLEYLAYFERFNRLREDEMAGFMRGTAADKVPMAFAGKAHELGMARRLQPTMHLHVLTPAASISADALRSQIPGDDPSHPLVRLMNKLIDLAAQARTAERPNP